MSASRASIVGIGAVVVAGLVVAQVERPVPPATTSVAVAGDKTIAGHLHMPWPSGTQVAEEVPGLGWIGGGQHGPSAPEPTGSLAKMMTALLVIQKHPLGEYASGPHLKMTAADQAMYQSDAARYQSVMPVTAGESLSERKLLEGLLIPSGNNVATLLAKWVSGSSTAFAREMNREAAKLGLTHTHYHGPVGLSARTVSTAEDQVKLAEIAMRSPVLKSISSMPQMTLPGGKVVYNYNNRLGRDGIFGVKTGSTVVGGASFIWGATATLGGQPHLIYGGVLGVTAAGNQLQHALDEGQKLILATRRVVTWHPLWHRGETIGALKSAWSPPVRLALVRSVKILGWPGLTYQVRWIPTRTLSKPQTLAKGTQIGMLQVTYGSQTIKVPVVTESAWAKPSLSWRLRRF